MQHVDNKGISIHYEVQGEGPPLVLMHGFGVSLEVWSQRGYVEALKNDHQLVLIDGRGFGASDKPHDPEAYKMALRVADVVAVLDALSVSKAHYLGHSMGGWIGWSIAKYAPERFYTLIIGGASPYGSLPEGEEWSFLELLKKGKEVFLAAGERVFGPRWTPELKAIISANDPEALIAVLSVQEELGIEDILPTIMLPCLLIGGEEDPLHAGAERCAKRMPNATCVTLPNLDHIEAECRTDLVLPHICQFLAEVSEH